VLPSGLFYVRRRIRELRRSYGRVFLLACCIACIYFAAPANAQQAKPEEYRVKAAYLYNFGKFVDWPDTAAKDESFKICVLGRDPFGSELDATISGETIDNRKLVALRIASPGDAAGCRILFISSSETAHLKEILAVVDKSGV